MSHDDFQSPFDPNDEPEPQEPDNEHVEPESQIDPIDIGDPGRQAVRNGSEAEAMTRERLLRLGYIRLKTMPDIKEQPFFIAQWRSPYTGPYGTQLVPDFYVWHPRKCPAGLLIEHKYQEKSGSADQKLHFAVAGLKKTGLRSILVATGRGFSRHALVWCKEQEDALFTAITSADEWTMRLNRGLL